MRDLIKDEPMRLWVPTTPAEIRTKGMCVTHVSHGQLHSAWLPADICWQIARAWARAQDDQ